MKPITRRQFLQAAAAAGILGSAAVAGAAPEQAVNWFYRNRLGTLYCHEGDWSWIYFFNGQCADAAGTALWQWLGQQRR